MHKITLPYPSAKLQLFLVYQKKSYLCITIPQGDTHVSH